MKMETDTREDFKPDWFRRAESIPYRPGWCDKIPRKLHSLGEVFFPIPRGVKGHNWPHHMQEFRYTADSEVLNAYLETGWGYGIACANDLVVVDVDEKEFIGEVTERLPATLWQVTGSREGVHLFYMCPGLNTRQILHHKSEPHVCDEDGHSCGYEDGECVKEWEWEHLGEVKADPHGYVIGPGSIHPSGNEYGPLKGDEITTIEKKDLLDALKEYDKPSFASSTSTPTEWNRGSFTSESRYDFYLIDADDVFPWLEPENRIAHPVHGSSTYNQTGGKMGNFMKNSDGKTFTCWRHNSGGSQGCGLNGTQLLAQMEAVDSGYTQYEDCEIVRMHWQDEPLLHWLGWRRAVDKGLVGMGDIPYKVLLGYGLKRGIIDSEDQLEGETYWDLVNAIRYEIIWSEL